MSIWIELHCDAMSEHVELNPDYQHGELYLGCECHHHDGPMMSCRPTRANLARALTELGDEARHRGWKRIRRFWVCPWCLTRPRSEWKILTEDDDDHSRA